MRANHTKLRKSPEPKAVDTKKLLESSNTKYYGGSNSLTCSCSLFCICLWITTGDGRPKKPTVLWQASPANPSGEERVGNPSRASRCSGAAGGGGGSCTGLCRAGGCPPPRAWAG